jgi:predicted TIM-barrel enzyme
VSAQGARPVLHVILAVDPQRFADVVKAVRDAGLAVEAEQPQIGTITGTIREDLLPTLEAVDGVDAVECERHYQLPPPDSPIQ